MTLIEKLRALSGKDKLGSELIFESISRATELLNDSDRESDEALEIAIRLLESCRQGGIDSGSKASIDFLVEECGLYPYIDKEKLSFVTQSIIEAHSVNLQEQIYLHAKQMKVLLWLLDGANVVLSAPTSFGKSLLVDAFIKKKSPQTVVMILPTIALIDECRRRLIRNFKSDYKIITTVHDAFDENSKNIFVLTQERFLARDDIKKVDFLFVDEFYKLDPSRDDGRFETLNLALYKLLPISGQCFMAGPHIKGIDLGDKLNSSFKFLETHYRTVTVNVIDRSNKEEKLETFLHDLQHVDHESSLVFTSTPGSANNLMNSILEANIGYESNFGQNLSKWIAENYHPDWGVSKGVANGIAMHHGRMPRSLGQVFVHLFNTGDLKVLLCTSTLIEGVNTSAANVFVYDKKINRTDLDFFSFANITGRVGRMMRHFIGNAYLYHEPPKHMDTHVQVPIFSSPNESTDYLLINLNSEELSESGKDRQKKLPINSGITQEILKQHGSIGIESLVLMQNLIRRKLAEYPENLIWSGHPNREQRLALAEIVVATLNRNGVRTGLYTAKQVAWAWGLLKSCKTLPAFLRWFSRTFGRDDKNDSIDAAFQFFQACEFTFPRVISAVEALVKEFTKSDQISYLTYCAQMECWFRPQWMKGLDEVGIPIPLTERLMPHLAEVQSRDEALAVLKGLNIETLQNLSDIDKFILGYSL